MTTTTIRIQTTDFDSDQPFPEASSYPDYVAERVAAILRDLSITATVECEGGHLATRVFGLDDDDLTKDFVSQIDNELWTDFCDHGYKAYSKAAFRVETLGEDGPSDGVWELEPNGECATQEEAEKCVESLVADLGYDRARIRIVTGAMEGEAETGKPADGQMIRNETSEWMDHIQGRR